MNESSNRRGIVVGFFIFLGLLFLVGGILMVGNLHETFKKKMKVVSFFEDVNGLQKGNNIWFSGVKIGTVSSLRFRSKSEVEVIMKIEIKAKPYIRRDAMVKVGTDGLIGNKILVIYGGTAGSGEIEEGDTLGVEKTFSSDDMINTLQENNKNLLAITTDFKVLSNNMVNGGGTIGKLLNDNAVYSNMNMATLSLQRASERADHLMASLAVFSSGLNKKGTLANDLVTDTVIVNSVRASVLQLKQITDTATAFITNLKQAGANPNTSMGVLLHDEETGARLKETVKYLNSSAIKLDEDLEAAQHNFLLRGFFKKRAKSAPPADPRPLPDSLK